MTRHEELIADLVAEGWKTHRFMHELRWTLAGDVKRGRCSMRVCRCENLDEEGEMWCPYQFWGDELGPKCGTQDAYRIDVDGRRVEIAEVDVTHHTAPDKWGRLWDVLWSYEWYLEVVVVDRYGNRSTPFREAMEKWRP